MRAYVFPTDTAWTQYLRELQQRDPTQTEANFWIPSGWTLKSLEVGDRFLMRSKATEGGRIVGALC